MGNPMLKLSPKKNSWPVYGLLIVQLLIGVALMPKSNFISIYLNEVMAYSVRQVAQVIVLGQVVGMVASLVGGGMADRWGHKKILILGISIIALSSLLYVFRVPWLIFAFWGLSSVGLGFATLSGQSYLTLTASATTLGLFSALYNWGYTVGGAVGNPIAAMILGQGNYLAFGWAMFGLGLFTTFIAFFLPHVRLSPDSYRKGSGLKNYRILFHHRIFLLGLLRFLPTSYYGVLTLLPLLIKQHGGNNTTVAWFATGSAILASISQMLAGKVSDRWGVRSPTVVAFIVILIAIGGTIITAQSLWGLYIFGALGISAAWALSTLLPSLVKVAAEPEIHGRVFGILHLLWTFGMILGTLLGGTLLEIDVRLPFIIVGILNVIALILTVPFFSINAAKTQSGS